MFKNIFGGKKAIEQGIFEPRMPDVDIPTNLADTFDNARKAARGEMNLPGAKAADRYLMVVTPGRMLMYQPCPPAGSMSASQTAAYEKLISPAVKRNIAVIAYTELKAVQSDFSKAIPFAGMLMGFAYIGHAVWVFEGHPSALAAGCKDAELLILDGGMLPYLAENWLSIVSSVMRHKEIYVHDRATFKLTRVKEMQ
jgi:hypothetical protein